jgi:addiction module RelB/DinJ family antitoxin
MTTSVVVRARVDEGLKRKVEPLLAAVGLTLSDAYRLLLLRIAHDEALPFEPIYLDPAPIPVRHRDMSEIITHQMRHHVVVKAHDHFGFSGYRAAIACLYARPEGATQMEANEAARLLGSLQSGYFNMLRQAKNKWKHDVVVWDDPAREGKVYKLIFNPNHSAPHSVDPPPEWREMNVPKAPTGVRPTPYKPRSSN